MPGRILLPPEAAILWAEHENQQQPGTWRGMPMGFGSRLLSWSMAFLLTLGWVSPVVWSGHCGTPAMNLTLACGLFCIVSIGLALRVGIAHRDLAGAMQLVASGSLPLVFPLLVRAIGEHLR
jgi:hypothetical protein